MVSNMLPESECALLDCTSLEFCLTWKSLPSELMEQKRGHWDSWDSRWLLLIERDVISLFLCRTIVMCSSDFIHYSWFIFMSANIDVLPQVLRLASGPVSFPQICGAWYVMGIELV